MPFKEKQREYWKDRKRKERVSTPDNVHPEMSTPGNHYPAIVYALCDPEKREKLERICIELKRHNVLEVRYGLWGPTFDVVGELIECTGG